MISTLGITGAGERVLDRRTRHYTGLAVLRRAADACWLRPSAAGSGTRWRPSTITCFATSA